jgi:hypothetical protein
MRQILESLARVQEMDNAIKSLEDGRARLPAERAAVEAGVAAADGKKAEVSERRQELEKKRRSLEQQVEDANQAVKKHQRQAFEVKTNKEYTAMLHEIEGEKKRISELEESILVLMEEADGLVAAERQEAERAAAVRREAEGKRTAIEARAARIDKELAAATEARQREFSGLPADIMAVYRRVSRGRQGLAVVPMVGGACGGCFSNLPTRLTVEVKAMEELITCEACGRILIWKEEGRAGKGQATT